MPGVDIVEEGAFNHRLNLVDLECGKLEIIRVAAFLMCKSLRSINLPFAEIVAGRREHLLDAERWRRRSLVTSWKEWMKWHSGTAALWGTNNYPIER